MPRRLLAAAAALLLAGCDWYYNTLPSPDDLMAAVPWFDHMIKSRAVHPYQRADVPRATVPGTVPITGNEANDSTLFKSGNASLADRLVNPTDAAATLVKGDTLYRTFCAVCHGQAGAGDGLVRVGAPSLLTASAQARSDGYLYSIIRYGRGVMPRYGDKVYLREDRWAIVNYVRKLQRDASVVLPVPAVGGAGR
jgi:mono/diheme cytochrome c family protein